MDTRKEFSGEDVDFLSKNLHKRYLEPSKTVGHAVIVNDSVGKKQFLQYAIPPGSAKAPQFIPLLNIEEIQRNGMTRYRAKTLDGTPMFASRFIDGDFDGQSFQIACFSPRTDGKEPFWGNDTVPELFAPIEEKGKDAPEDDEVAVPLPPVRTKGGKTLLIEPASVQIKTSEHIRCYYPDQNEVMGLSAKELNSTIENSV